MQSRVPSCPDVVHPSSSANKVMEGAVQVSRAALVGRRELGLDAGME